MNWKFNCESKGNIDLPPKYTFPQAFNYLNSENNSFYILENEGGYIQCGGDKTKCSVELRKFDKKNGDKHYVFYDLNGTNEDVQIPMSDGVIQRKSKHILNFITASELFKCYYENSPWPENLKLEDITHELVRTKASTEDTSSILERVENKSLTERDTPEAFSLFLKSEIEKWLKELTRISMKGRGQNPDWLVYEMRLWETGESIRQILSINSKWKKSETLKQLFYQIVLDKRLGKGRQPFVELTARNNKQKYVEIASELIQDPEVSVRAVNALKFAKLKNFTNLVEKELKHPKQKHLLKEAKKYFKWVEKQKQKDLTNGST